MIANTKTCELVKSEIILLGHTYRVTCTLQQPGQKFVVHNLECSDLQSAKNSIGELLKYAKANLDKWEWWKWENRDWMPDLFANVTEEERQEAWKRGLVI